jgi:clan AA aspartic protease (TIGR02281 family)
MSEAGMRQLGLAAIAAAALAGIVPVVASKPPQTGRSRAIDTPSARPALPRVPASPVSIRPDEGSQLYFVTVGIAGPAGWREFNCILDTGASFLSIARSQAEQLGFDPGQLDFSAPVKTANGRTSDAAIRLRSVVIAGRFALTDVPALVSDGGDDGCEVGQSVLKRLRVTLADGSLELSNKKASK